MRGKSVLPFLTVDSKHGYGVARARTSSALRIVEKPRTPLRRAISTSGGMVS